MTSNTERSPLFPLNCDTCRLSETEKYHEESNPRHTIIITLFKLIHDRLQRQQNRTRLQLKTTTNHLSTTISTSVKQK